MNNEYSTNFKMQTFKVVIHMYTIHSTYTLLNGVFHEFYVTPLHGPKNLKMMTDVPFYVSKYIF